MGSEAIELKVQRSQLRDDRKKRVVILSALGAICFVFVLLGFAGERFLNLVSVPSQVMFGLSFILFISLAGVLTYFYLQGGVLLGDYFKALEAEEDRVSEIGLDSEDARSELVELRENFKGLENAVASAFSGDLVNVTQYVVDKVKEKAVGDVWKELNSLRQGMRRLEVAEEKLDDSFLDIEIRIRGEIKSLSKRGNINLALGVFTTLAAIIFLGLVAFDTAQLTRAESMLASSKGDVALLLVFMFVPKLSLAVFAQVFAFFFLRLYKSGLADIKYYQNEITNSQFKQVAIRAAMVESEVPAFEFLCKDLIATERNHVLTPGQTTIELEKHKLEVSSSNELIKLLPKIFGKPS